MEPEIIWKIFVPSGRFCCETKTALLKSLLKKKSGSCDRQQEHSALGVTGPRSSLGVSFFFLFGG